MVDRIVLGQSGSQFVIRVSREGYDVDTAPPDGFLFTEQTQSLRPNVSGSHTFSGSGSHVVSLTGLSSPPKVILKGSDNKAPSKATFYAKVRTNGSQITIVNVSGARTVHYYVLGGSINNP